MTSEQQFCQDELLFLLHVVRHYDPTKIPIRTAQRNAMLDKLAELIGETAQPDGEEMKPSASAWYTDERAQAILDKWAEKPNRGRS